jgi:hypothetical protein
MNLLSWVDIPAEVGVSLTKLLYSHVTKVTVEEWLVPGQELHISSLDWVQGHIWILNDWDQEVIGVLPGSRGPVTGHILVLNDFEPGGDELLSHDTLELTVPEMWVGVEALTLGLWDIVWDDAVIADVFVEQHSTWAQDVIGVSQGFQTKLTWDRIKDAMQNSPVLVANRHWKRDVSLL